MKISKSTALLLVALMAPAALGGCALAAGAAVGAAAVDYFVDDNDTCEGPNDAGLLDSDCHDDNPN